MYLPDKAGRRRATTVFLLPSLVGIIGFCLLPIAGSLFFSLMDYDLLRPMDSMTFVGLKNFVRVLTGREFRGVLAHTFTYLGLYLPLIMAASVGEALILNKSFRGHGCSARCAIRRSSPPGWRLRWCGSGCSAGSTACSTRCSRRWAFRARPGCPAPRGPCPASCWPPYGRIPAIMP